VLVDVDPITGNMDPGDLKKHGSWRSQKTAESEIQGHHCGSSLRLAG
jgi:hypothetical protein